MTFLEPLFFSLGAAVAAGIVVLHFIVTRQPAERVLPTVRFVPPSAVRVPTLTRRPEHLLLLLLRVLLALLIGAAFARPVLTGGERPVARIVLADVSRHTAALGPVRDTARALLGEGDVLVVFDSAARLVPSGADSIVRQEPARVSGRLSPALIRGLRAASDLRSSADSVELVLVSPFHADEWDDATDSIRALWPGRIRLVRTPAARDSAPGGGLAVVADSADPLRVAASLVPAGRDTAVRLIRTQGTTADSLWAAAGLRVLVRWPASEAPPGWLPRAPADTAGAVVIGGVTMVHPFPRRWRPGASAGRVVAHWVDGEAAATERRHGLGCVRDVGIAVPAFGDVVLRPAFARVFDALTAPCGEVGRGAERAAPDLAAFAGTGPLASKATLAAPATLVPPLVPWLLAAALLLALAEPLVRRRGAGGPA